MLGYDVWLGEALLSAAAIVLCGFLCIRSKRLAAALQTVMAVVLFAGILVGFFAVTGLHRAGGLSYAPLFAPRRGTPAGQIFTIVVLAPWAFVGFESVSNSPSGFKFSPKKSIWIMLAALITGAASYLLLSLIAAALPPEGYAGWPEYLEDLDSLDGLSGLPTFFATHRALGEAGLAVLGAATLSAIGTGLIGNFTAASRLMYAMAEDGILPEWFGRLNGKGSPRNALLLTPMGTPRRSRKRSATSPDRCRTRPGCKTATVSSRCA
ncbi:MAG: APC family permease [Oscillospiraceae bacterium]|nr:APC family permease [Oscillospiraceae bacterium]